MKKTNTTIVRVGKAVACQLAGALLLTAAGTHPCVASGYENDGPGTVANEGGKDLSVEVGGLYLERHPVKPGEWTTDVDGVKEAASKDGRLIAVLLANYATCTWCQEFDLVANREEFLSWAVANGVYLVTADRSLYSDAQAAYDWFWDLYYSYGDSGGVGYPTFYFARPNAPMTAIGKGVARNYLGQYNIGTVTYDGSVEALIAGFASVLGESVPSAPATTTASLVSSYPVSVTLTNPNGSGTIRYTLDGSAPTRMSMQYTGPISIVGRMTLKAAVWQVSGCSSAVMVRGFQTFEEALGTAGMTWSTGGDHKWEADSAAEKTLKTPYVSGQNYTSWLQATVCGKGRLVFTLKGSSNASVNRISFTVNGSQTYTYGYSSTYGTSRTVSLTNEVTTTGTTTFKWTYTVGNAEYHYANNGARLYDVRWIPEGGSVTPGVESPYTPAGWTTPISVDNDWLIAKGLAKAGDSMADVAAKLAANGKNGIPRYQSYLLGMEPDSEVPAGEQLKVKIEGFDANGLPIITWEPEPNDASRVKYVKLGKADLLSDAKWTEVTTENEATMRFYRIKAVIAP